MQNIRAERAFYDKLFEDNPANEHISDGYEELHDLAFSASPQGTVLDIGCGTGGHAIRLAGRGFDIVAVDLTKPGVQAARARFERAGLTGRFLVADAEHLPFRDGMADVIWSSLLIHHFPRLDLLPTELARVTRRRLIAFEPNAQNPLSWLAFNVINPAVGLSTTTKNQRSLMPGKLVRTFKAAGFQSSEIHFIHRPWKDAQGGFAFVRRIFEIFTSWLPLRFKANKFMVIWDKALP